MARTNELDRALTEITRRLDVLETCEKLLLAGTNVKAALATAREAKKLLLDAVDAVRKTKRVRRVGPVKAGAPDMPQV